jgi:hypothetical protein
VGIELPIPINLTKQHHFSLPLLSYIPFISSHRVMPADGLLNQLVWILPASITIAIGIVTIMGLFGGNQMPVKGKVSDPIFHLFDDFM